VAKSMHRRQARILLWARPNTNRRRNNRIGVKDRAGESRRVHIDRLNSSPVPPFALRPQIRQVRARQRWPICKICIDPRSVWRCRLSDGFETAIGAAEKAILTHTIRFGYSHFGSWLCEYVGRTLEMPVRPNCADFGANEINGLEGTKLRVSSRFAQETGKTGVFTQPRSS